MHQFGMGARSGQEGLVRPVLVVFLLACSIREGHCETPEESQGRASIPPSQWNVSSTSIVFVKFIKVGGSTVGGIVRRVADHHGLAGARGTSNHWNKCKTPSIWANHIHFTEVANGVAKCRRMGMPTFLLTWVRSPLNWCLSYFYHLKASRAKVEATEKHKLDACGINSGHHSSQQFIKYLAPSHSSTPEEALNAYNFVGVTDRFDESIVVLQDILGLSIGDILYVTAKNSSSGQRDTLDRERDTKIIPYLGLTHESENIQNLASDEAWRKSYSWPLGFFQMASQRLDEHIARIGKEEFDVRLKKFQRLRQLAHSACGHEANPQCYWNDNGCNYKCLDKIESIK